MTPLRAAGKPGTKDERSPLYFTVRQAVTSGLIVEGRRGRNAGGEQTRLATEFGVSRQAISDMVKRVRRDIAAEAEAK